MKTLTTSPQKDVSGNKSSTSRVFIHATQRTSSPKGVRGNKSPTSHIYLFHYEIAACRSCCAGLTSTHNLSCGPPARLGGERSARITCPPDRVPRAPAGELRPLHPRFMSGCQARTLTIEEWKTEMLAEAVSVNSSKTAKRNVWQDCST